MHLRPYTIIMSSKTIPCAACCRGGIDVGVPIGPCRMKIRLILKEILPFYFRLVVLAAVTLFIDRSEEHTSELQSLMRISYAVFCLKKKKHHKTYNQSTDYRTLT